MTLIRHCIINDSDIVVNIIEYEQAQTGTPEGLDTALKAIQSDIGQIGWVFDNGTFTDPNPPIIPLPALTLPTTAELMAQLQIIQAQITTIGIQ